MTLAASYSSVRRRRSQHFEIPPVSRPRQTDTAWGPSRNRRRYLGIGERAVRAALAIQRALVELNRENAGSRRPELVARIGVESGAVVVDEAGEIFGDAPNVAARVQALAAPGTVLITARVQRQVAGLFVAEDLGARAERRARADDALSDRAREWRPALRRPRADSAGRTRGGARPLAPALGKGGERRGPAGAGGRRARHRQVAPHRGVSLEARRDAAHLCRMVVVAAVAEHAAASGRRMGPAAIRRGFAR
jgi:hypothetical protein